MLVILSVLPYEKVHKLVSFVYECPHLSPAEGVTLMASTPSGRAISWLYSLSVVRLRRQALCRFEVHGLVFGVTGELNVSKVNWELFIGEAVVASLSVVVSSGGTQIRRGNYFFFFIWPFLFSQVSSSSHVLVAKALLLAAIHLSGLVSQKMIDKSVCPEAIVAANHISSYFLWTSKFFVQSTHPWWQVEQQDGDATCGGVSDLLGSIRLPQEKNVQKKPAG